MEYIGEHLLPGQLGRFFVSLALASAVISALAYYYNSKREDTSYRKLARWSFWVHALSVFGIVGTLFYMMLGHFFEYDYVWSHSSTDLPLRYIFSAFWEGQEGSFILWLFWHAVLGLVFMYTARNWESISMVVFSLVQAFLTSMILGIYPFGLKIGSSPFVLMRNTADNVGLPWTQFADYLDRFPAFMDGSGLNPLLQNYWMTIHPPVLFLGFASTLIPFAIAVAALFKKDYTGWVKPALPWAFFSVMIFGLGILMGGAWAYEALSFGGFWAWDPVENSSLVPWLTMVGAAHLLLVYRNKKSGLTAAFFMTIISFLLVLFSTFLTRSGILGKASVHSFVDLGLSGQLLIYLLFFVLISFWIFFRRMRHIPRPEKEDSLHSREFWMFIGSLTLLIAAFQIIWVTSYGPIANALIGPEGWIPIMDDEIAPPIDAIGLYNSFQVPFAIVVTLLMAIGQFLSYRSTKASVFWKNILRSLLFSIVLTALTAQMFNFWRQPLYLTLLFTGTFAFISNLDFWLISRRGKSAVMGSSIAHIGFALIVIGALISNAKKKMISQSSVFLSEDLPANENLLMELGDTLRLGDYAAIYEGVDEIGDKKYYNVSYYLGSEDNLEKQFTLRPFLQITEEMGPSANPSTKHFWDRDIYTHVQFASDLEPKSPDGYSREMEVELGIGDTAEYQGHFLILDSIIPEQQPDQQIIRLTAAMRVVNVMGQEFSARPFFQVEGNTLSNYDAYMEEQQFKLRLADVNTQTDKMLIKAWTKEDEDEKPIIVLKAIVFPLINLLWAGCILMVIGTGIAIWQRVKK